MAISPADPDLDASERAMWDAAYASVYKAFKAFEGVDFWPPYWWNVLSRNVLSLLFDL